MKNLFLILLALISLHAEAQKSIVKEAAFKNQPIEVDLDFATSIEIITWDKPKVQVKATAVTEEPEAAELFNVDLEEKGNRLFITSNSKDVLKTFQEDRDVPNIKVIYTNMLEHEFTYQLMVPKEVSLQISSISGTITSEYVEGEITADLVSGNIRIKDFKGDLDLDTVNGRIELPGKNSSVNAKTVVGRIEVNKDLALPRKDKFVGQEVSFESAGSANRMKLETVNGTIVLN